MSYFPVQLPCSFYSLLLADYLPLQLGGPRGLQHLRSHIPLFAFSLTWPCTYHALPREPGEINWEPGDLSGAVVGFSGKVGNASESSWWK